MYAIELSAIETFVLQAMLPQQGNMLQLGIQKTISEKLGLSPEYLEEIDFVVTDRMIHSNPEKDKPVRYIFTDPEFEIIRTAMQKLDKENSVRPDQYNVCCKIRDAKKAEMSMDES